MNLRCAFCQTPYAIGRAETMSALQMMDAEKLAHYDAHCPRCRRVTQIPFQKLEMSLPHWKETPAETPAPEAAPVKKAASKPKAESAAKPAAAKKAPVKKSAAK
jgi:phage FluMu protein Com